MNGCPISCLLPQAWLRVLFEKWCKWFDNVFTHKAQKREFRDYLGGLLGESERKNLFQMADNAVGITYHCLHHILTKVR